MSASVIRRNNVMISGFPRSALFFHRTFEEHFVPISFRDLHSSKERRMILNQCAHFQMHFFIATFVSLGSEVRNSNESRMGSTIVCVNLEDCRPFEISVHSPQSRLLEMKSNFPGVHWFKHLRNYLAKQAAVLPLSPSLGARVCRHRMVDQVVTNGNSPFNGGY